MILKLHFRVFIFLLIFAVTLFCFWLGNFGVVLHLVENGQNKKFRAVSFVCFLPPPPPFKKKLFFSCGVFKFQTLLTFNYSYPSPSFTAKLGGNFIENLPKCTSNGKEFTGVGLLSTKYFKNFLICGKGYFWNFTFSLSVTLL